MKLDMLLVAFKEIEHGLDFWTDQLGFTAGVAVRNDASGKINHAGARFADGRLMISLAGDEDVAASAGIGVILLLSCG